MSFSRNFSGFLAIVLFVIALGQVASAKEYHISLLTVGESGDTVIGGTADAYLEIRPGSGRIFLDSFPATKLDTQISTRYASQVACDFLDESCDKYDFFYTIRADSTIVGGPSASAPLTILTIAALKGLELRNDTVMTGTINSGGSIGPVGGIIEKVGAAQAAGFKRALIPTFAIIPTNKDNKSKPVITTIKVTTSSNRTNVSVEDIVSTGKENVANASSYFSNMTIDVIRVSNLEEAIPYFMDLPIMDNNGRIDVPQEYVATMAEVANSLCAKAESLKGKLELNSSDLNKTLDFEKKINASIESGNYYSAASFCFNVGVVLRRINLARIEDADPGRLEKIRSKALDAVRAMDASLEKKNITTLPELEAYIIVKERLLESERLLVDGGDNISSDSLAYAIERYYSAVFWSSFFRLPGKSIDLDAGHLESACHKKISEAEERINYVNLYLPSSLAASRTDLDEAHAFSKDGNFKMCLFKASFAKAEANLLLSSIAVETDQIGNLSLEKLSAAHKLVSKEQKRGFFPIMGYSYYEYALSLNKNDDELSSLIFAEYSLELSNLEMYFPKSAGFDFVVDYALLALLLCVFLFGFFMGSSVMLGYLAKRKPAEQKKVHLRGKVKVSPISRSGLKRKP